MSRNLDRDLFGNPAPSPRRGNLGKSWENHLDRLHYRYGREGRAIGFHTHAAVVVHRQLQGGKAITSFVEKSEPDYGLVMPELARFCWLEAKKFEGTSWPLAKLKPHQAEHLDRVIGMGGGSYLLILGEEVGFGWLVPWAEVGEAWTSWYQRTGRARPGEASLSRARLDHVAIYSDPVEAFDYLDRLVKDLAEQRVSA